MPRIIYSFSSAGADQVIANFRSIEDAANRSGKAVEAALKASAKPPAGPRGAGGGGAGRGRSPADDEAKAAKRVADAKIREETRAARYVAGIRDKHFRDTQAKEERYAQQNARTKERYAEREVQAASRVRSERLKAVGSLARSAAFAGAGAVLAGGAAIGGGAARDAIKLDELSRRLSISARGSGERGADPTQLRKEFQAAAIANPGIKATDIAEGAQAFVAKTGELGVARENAGTFATVANATGTRVQDVADAGADLFQKFDIKTIDEMRDAFAALTFQGKKGAFELKDAAEQFPKIAAAAQRFGLPKGAEGVRLLGGLTQIARQSTGSPEEATTALENVFSELQVKTKQLRAAGVDIYRKDSQGRHTTQTKDIREVLTDVISKNKGDVGKIEQIVGQRGIRAISPLVSTFNQTREVTQGTDAQKTAAGVAALNKAFADAIDAPGTWAEVVKDAATSQESSSAQIDGAWQRLTAEVGDAVLPTLATLVPALVQLAEGGITPLVTVMQALAEAAQLAVDGLKFLGFLKPKQPGTGDRLAESTKALADFDKKTPGLSPLLLNDEQYNKRTRLQAGLAAADAAAFKAPGEAFTPEELATQKDLANKGFAARFANESGAAPGSDESVSVGKLAGYTQDAVAGHDYARLATIYQNANPAQKAEVSDYAKGEGAYAGQRTPEESAAAGKALEDAATALKDAAAGLKDANNKPTAFH